MSTHVIHKGGNFTPPGETVYEKYLRTTELLALQKPDEQRAHPDELTFQVVHQTFELWWKVTVQQLRTAQYAIAGAKPAEAASALRRAISQQELVRAVMRQLEYVSPVDFLMIREGLSDGSGMDSPGFRAILRAAPELWRSFSASIERAHLSLEEIYLHPAEHFAWYEFAEALTDFDEQFHLFRAQHLKLAERNLGMHAVGTGGTQLGALEQTLRDLLFPDLWAVRDALLARANAATTRGGGDASHTGGH